VNARLVAHGCAKAVRNLAVEFFRQKYVVRLCDPFRGQRVSGDDNFLNDSGFVGFRPYRQVRRTSATQTGYQ